MHDLVADPRLQRTTAEAALAPQDARSTREQVDAIGRKCTSAPRRPTYPPRRAELKQHGEILNGDAAVAQLDAVGDTDEALDARMRAKALKRHESKRKPDEAVTKLEALRQVRTPPPMPH